MCPGVMKPGKKLRWLNVSKSMLSRVSAKNYLSPIRQKNKKKLSKKKGQDGRASDRVETEKFVCFSSFSHVFTSWLLLHVLISSLEFLF